MARRRRPDDALRASASIAGLVVFNALIFDEILAGADARVRGLVQVERGDDPVGDLVETWDFVEREIDYVPIFRVARSVLEEVAGGEVDDAVLALCRGARDVVRKKAALRHDLMGRVYHRLLLDAKYLAETLDDARHGIGGNVDRYHNRPHSGLDYRTPFEV
jgi:hypothetical protein